jgi:hypothetical protein
MKMFPRWRMAANVFQRFICSAVSIPMTFRAFCHQRCRSGKYLESREVGDVVDSLDTFSGTLKVAI